MVHVLKVEQGGSFGLGWNTVSFSEGESLPAGIYFGRIGPVSAAPKDRSASPVFRFFRLK
jgi:hypothetical protein